MLRIRLRRSGKTGEPSYRIVVAEESAPIQGKFIAQLGHYNPKSKVLVLDKDAAKDWLNKGAKPSNTVAKLMTKEKMNHKSIVIHKFRKISAKELAAQKEAEEAERVKREAEKEAAKEEWDKEAEAKAAEHESSDDKLLEATEAETGTTPEPEAEVKPTESSDKPAEESAKSEPESTDTTDKSDKPAKK